jgi:hypothetical protein
MLPYKDMYAIHTPYYSSYSMQPAVSSTRIADTTLAQHCSTTCMHSTTGNRLSQHNPLLYNVHCSACSNSW